VEAQWDYARRYGGLRASVDESRLAEQCINTQEMATLRTRVLSCGNLQDATRVMQNPGITG
jgi:hypothetical protein